MRFWKLNADGIPTPSTLDEYTHAPGGPTTRVAYGIINGREISTIFRGIDFAASGPPQSLWETIVWDTPKREHTLYEDRWNSREEALEGHFQQVAKAMVSK